MNDNPDQWMMENRINSNWEYLGLGWFTMGDMFGCFLNDDFFLAYHSPLH